MHGATTVSLKLAFLCELIMLLSSPCFFRDNHVEIIWANIEVSVFMYYSNYVQLKLLELSDLYEAEIRNIIRRPSSFCSRPIGSEEKNICGKGRRFPYPRLGP